MHYLKPSEISKFLGLVDKYENELSNTCNPLIPSDNLLSQLINKETQLSASKLKGGLGGSYSKNLSPSVLSMPNA